MTTLRDILEAEARPLEVRARNTFARLARDVASVAADPSRLTAEEVRQFSATLAMVQTDLATVDGLKRAMELHAESEPKPEETPKPATPAKSAKPIKRATSKERAWAVIDGTGDPKAIIPSEPGWTPPPRGEPAEYGNSWAQVFAVTREHAVDLWRDYLLNESFHPLTERQALAKRGGVLVAVDRVEWGTR